MKKHLWLILFAVMAGCKDEAEDPTPDPTLVYFLVGEKEPEHGDSFILALKKEDDIEEARQRILNEESPIIVAEISKNDNDHYYLNKDIANNRRWSWHITEFLGFADNTIEILDGWPGYVEENYSEWVKTTKGENGKGRIGFWNYTLVREVPHEELYEEDQ